MDKKNREGRCVYTVPADLCPGTSQLHPKEHYLPAGLGNFEGDVRLRDFICYDCQKRFAQFEEVFLRNSTEAFFRKILGVQGRKNHSPKNIFVEPTLGLPPLTVKAMHPSIQQEFLWEMNSDSEAYLMHQLVFRKPDESLVHVPIRSGLIAKNLEAQSPEWREWQLVACIAGETDEDELQVSDQDAMMPAGYALIVCPGIKEISEEAARCTDCWCCSDPSINLLCRAVWV